MYNDIFEQQTRNDKILPCFVHHYNNTLLVDNIINYIYKFQKQIIYNYNK